jgi:flagellar motor switch protein FliM
MHGLIAKVVIKYRESKWKELDRKLDDIKSQMRAENSKKQDASYDFKERERELNEHLETMTQIAQRIDDENRALMKKNAELKIEYLSQENDRDLLLTQLLQQKKEH